MRVVDTPNRRLVSAIYPDFYPFDRMGLFNSFERIIEVNDLTENDVLLVWGGEDISPALYGEPVNRYGDGAVAPSYRDTIEWELMQGAKALGIPIIGICRGAQMLCALAGGSLWQDVQGHCGNHIVTTYDGQELKTNSLHHQMLRLDNIPKDEYDLIAWTQPRSQVYHHGAALTHMKKPGDLDPEFVFFNKVNGFAVQWHPEFVDYPDQATDYVFNFIKEKLEVTV